MARKKKGTPMKRIIIAFAILGLFWPPLHAAAQELPAQAQPFPVYRYTLDNGLRLWVQPRADSESVATRLVVGVGSRYESRANNGISHYVEHLLFTGTERWSEDEIKQVITRQGGRWNGLTGLETTSYYAHVAAQDVDIALDWLAQIVFHPTFAAEKVDKERQVIFQERWGHYGWLINALDSLGFGYELWRDIRRAIFPDSSLGMTVGGEDASLESLDRKALLDYYQRYYTPENAILIVVGNVEPQEILERATTYFGDIESRGQPPLPETPRLADDGPRRVVIRGPLPTDQTQLVVGARTVGLGHPDRWPLQVLAQILSVELTEEIRNRRGLVYGLGAFNGSLTDAGYFAVTTTSEGKHTGTIQEIIEGRLDGIRRGEVDAKAVDDAKTALQGRWALLMEDNMERASWLADWSAALSDGEPLPDYQAAIGAVTVDDLARVVDTYFTPQRSFVGLHAPLLTVASGATWFAGLVVLGVAVWGVRRFRRRRKRSAS